MAEGGDDPALTPWLVRARGHDADAIMHRHLLVRRVEIRVVAARLGDAGPGV